MIYKAKNSSKILSENHSFQKEELEHLIQKNLWNFRKF
mgnify:CR=1 FL=1